VILDPAQLRLAAFRRAEKLRLAGQRFTPFVEAVSRDERGNPFRLAPHHLAWHAHVDYCWSRRLHAGIMAHWGSGKSSGLIAPLIAFLLGRDPSRRIKVVCNDDGSAAGRVQVVSQILLSSTYRRIFPVVFKGGPWTQHKIFVNRPGWSYEASVEAKGVFSTGIGGRADFLFNDDLVDQKNSQEPAQRKRVKELFENTWMSRLEPTGLALAIMTPWHLDDLSFELQRRREWCFLIQRISEDLTHIEQEVINGGDDYPGLLPAADQLPFTPAP
jgi:hypothetical protein